MTNMTDWCKIKILDLCQERNTYGKFSPRMVRLIKNHFQISHKFYIRVNQLQTQWPGSNLLTKITQEPWTWMSSKDFTRLHLNKLGNSTQWKTNQYLSKNSTFFGHSKKLIGLSSQVMTKQPLQPSWSLILTSPQSFSLMSIWS